MNIQKRDPDLTEKKIIRAIGAVCADPSFWRTGDKRAKETEQTRHTKNAMAQIGKSEGYWVCASGCTHANGGEWLYDLCWLKYDGETLIAAPLVMEIEWYSRDTDIDDDFQKLVLARSDYRVMLLKINNHTSVEDLLVHVEHCRHGLAGDRYLFGCRDDTARKFDWYAYEIF